MDEERIHFISVPGCSKHLRGGVHFQENFLMYGPIVLKFGDHVYTYFDSGTFFIQALIFDEFEKKIVISF